MERIALTYEQIKQHNLTPNPTKPKDPRSTGYITTYGHKCWELDALPPDELQRLIETTILSYIDQTKWDLREKELDEKRSLIQDRVDDFFSNIKGD